MNFSIKMAPNHHHHHFMLNSLPMEPVSRTYQYRKIMKPMLERKRRARINKCLDELKDLMASTLQADGENVSKLEKADILELTVRHLQRLRETNALFIPNTEATLNMDKFWAGFQHCAAEVSQFLSKYDRAISGDLIKYIANHIPNMTAATAAAVVAVTKATAAATATETANYQRYCNTIRMNQEFLPITARCGNTTNNLLAIPPITATATTAKPNASSTHAIPVASPQRQQKTTTSTIIINKSTHPYVRTMQTIEDNSRRDVWRPW